MNRAGHNYLKQLEAQLISMHQPQLECPCHDLALDEDDFKRIFGAGDEQQQKPSSIHADWDDSGHGRRDFE